MHAALDAQAGADDDLGTRGTELPDVRQRRDRALGLAPALRRGLVAGHAADVAIRERLVPLDDIALVGQAAAEHVGQDGGGASGNRDGCVHGAVSFMPV